MGTSAAPKQEKKDFRESQFQPAKVQEPVPQRPSTPAPSSKLQLAKQLWYKFCVCPGCVFAEKIPSLPQEGQ